MPAGKTKTPTKAQRIIVKAGADSRFDRATFLDEPI